MKTNIILLVSISTFLITCKKDSDQKDEIPTCTNCDVCVSGSQPNLEYYNYEQIGHETLYINLNFCDKEGDIDWGMEDTSAIASNLKMVYYYKDSLGNWMPYDVSVSPPFDTLVFKYQIPTLPAPPISSITAIGNSSSPLLITLNPSQKLEGRIKIRLVAPYAAPLHNEIKFEISLYDKAMNVSNTITTGTINP
jgi:hypothetical protein